MCTQHLSCQNKKVRVIQVSMYSHGNGLMVLITYEGLEYIIIRNTFWDKITQIYSQQDIYWCPKCVYINICVWVNRRRRFLTIYHQQPSTSSISRGEYSLKNTSFQNIRPSRKNTHRSQFPAVDNINTWWELAVLCIDINVMAHPCRNKGT